MAEPVVLSVDDGSVLVWLPADARRPVAQALDSWRMRPRGRSAWQPPQWLERVVDAVLPGNAKPDAKTRAVLTRASVDLWLLPGSVESVSTTEAMRRLGLRSRRRVEQLRADGVLRPAGRGRVLAVDVEALRVARPRGCE